MLDVLAPEIAGLPTLSPGLTSTRRNSPLDLTGDVATFCIAPVAVRSDADVVSDDAVGVSVAA